MQTPFDQISQPLDGRIVAGLAKIGTALRSNAWKGAEALGLTPTQGEILALLRARAKAGMRLSEVADALAVRQPTASDAVAALVRKELVSRGPDPADGRAIALKLTRRGRTAADRIAHWPDFLLRAVDVLAPEEQAAVHLALIKMIRTLQVRGEIPVSRLCVTCRFFRPNAHDDPDTPHHCAFVDAPFGPRHLRLDCPEHEEAPAESRDALWTDFLANESNPSKQPPRQE
ncbi:MAG: MarR family winged helix-turn-helix transcriptional regulator [Alphaproteobacteria bacterium]|nr:MarR family winged helix-turn-helix transcriptional regulator [Alphaproteobacteria bacterium]